MPDNPAQGLDRHQMVRYDATWWDGPAVFRNDLPVRRQNSTHGPGSVRGDSFSKTALPDAIPGREGETSCRRFLCPLEDHLQRHAQ
jgi:hypothetical protein